MSEVDVEVNQEEKGRDPKEAAFFAALNQRKVISDAMKAGTLCCMPGEDGFADTTPAKNLVNGTNYHGVNQLYLKEMQKQNGYPSAEYVTFDQVQKAGQAIRKGEKGISLYFQEKNENGEYEQKSVRVFNVVQTVNPSEMKKYAEQAQQEKLEEKLVYLKTEYGDKFEMSEKKKDPVPPYIECSSITYARVFALLIPQFQKNWIQCGLIQIIYLRSYSFWQCQYRFFAGENP